MSAFLFDTLIWTAALIALVLILRRPVTRWFGAPTAYALWCLPFLRLILPPIELPAWLAPSSGASPNPQPAPEPAGPTTQFVINTTTGTGTAAPAGSVEVSTSLWDVLAGLPLTEIALTAWLGGAAVFLYLRFSAYFTLRAELMEGAREVGATPGPLGTIRLIETPGTPAPLAFGVVKPVIALPPGFMASVDREARDLALEHELQHHRGHDLLINILVQPLFALHWFNPLGRYGWLALRRDQEAACAAPVMASHPQEDLPETRARYANVIASFAAGPNIALAAPMACPVLGDKSIIQRLRNLKMTEQSSNNPNRKLASRLMIGAAVLALPLTASITYAESLAPNPPQPPQPTLVKLGVVPEAPKAPAAPPAPGAPPAPLAPQAPDAPEVSGQTTIITVDPDTGKTKTKAIKSKDGQTVRIKSKNKEMIVLRDGQTSRSEKVKVITKKDGISEAEMEIIMEEVREGLADADEALREVRVELQALENNEELQELIKGQSRTVVRMECESGSDEVSTTRQLEGGGQEVLICQSKIMAQALTGLEQARAAIAENSDMPKDVRKEVLKELDAQIKRWKKEAR